MFQKMKITCPRCQRSKSIVVSDDVPRQVFDLKCCEPQTLSMTVIGKHATFTMRRLEWDTTQALGFSAPTR